MSWVYLGYHQLLQRPVALKVVKALYDNPDWARQHAEQLVVEAQIMARLDHPNLARVLDLFFWNQVPVLVMELIEGRDLEETCALAPKNIAERRVLAWAEQLCDVLEYLHRQEPPVIVRDLKPSNVMLGRDGRLRLIDFGLAKLMAAGGRGGTRDIVRGMGSEGYAPLEQYAKASTDARSDLYALGATLYFLLTESAPPPASLRVAHGAPVKDPREVNPTISEETWRALQALLALKPEDRPASASAVKELLGFSKRPPEKAPEIRRCVVCHQPLQPVHRHDVEIDQCQECGGVWLDRGELARLIELGREETKLKYPRARYRRKVDSDHLDRDDSDKLYKKKRKKSKKKKRSGTSLLWQALKELLDFD